MVVFESTLAFILGANSLLKSVSIYIAQVDLITTAKIFEN